MQECPDCNPYFESNHGKKSISCGECGDTFDVSLSEIDERKFCSKECFSEPQNRNLFMSVSRIIVQGVNRGTPSEGNLVL